MTDVKDSKTPVELPTYKKKQVKKAMHQLGNRKAVCAILGISNPQYSNALRFGVTTPVAIRIKRNREALRLSEDQMRRILNVIAPDLV